MWKAQIPITTTNYNYLTSLPIKKDFIIGNSFNILPINSLTFLENYNFITITFKPYFSLLNFRNNLTVNISDLNIDIDTIYIDDTTEYKYIPTLNDIKIEKSYFQSNTIYSSPELYPLHIFRSKSINTSVFGIFRYKINNINSIRDLNIFFTNENAIRTIFISKKLEDPLQIVDKSFLEAYTFDNQTTVYIDYRIKIYDPNNTDINTLFNNTLSSKITPVKVYTHTLSDPFLYNVVTDGLRHYRKTINYNNVIEKGYLITSSHVYLIN